jgi:hypothetical protein
MAGSNARRERATESDSQISLSDIKDLLNATPNTAAAALAHIMPSGVLCGREFRCGDVYGTAAKKGGSFSFNIDRLTGDDFSGGTGLGRGLYGVFDVYVAHCHGNVREATKLAREFLKLPEDERPKPKIETARRQRKAGPWKAISPVPPEAGKPDFARMCPDGAQFIDAWAYRNATGDVLFWVGRYDTKDDKITPVISWGHDDNPRRRWKMRGTGMRILFGLELLAERPNAPVLVVEGEKTAMAARLLFPDWVIVTWNGGAKNVRNTDFSPLAGRRVVFLADADLPNEKTGLVDGTVAMRRAEERVRDVGAVETRIIILPAEFAAKKDGWDLDDPMPEGWTVDRLRDLIESTPTTFPPQPDPDPRGKVSGAETAVNLTPFWSKCDADGGVAFAEMALALDDWMTACEEFLEARDFYNDQMDALTHPGMEPKKRKEIRAQIMQSVRRKYPNIDLKNPPRLQIAAAAGLGKTTALRDTYLRYPKLWRYHFHGFFPLIKLAEDFEAAVLEKTKGQIHKPHIGLHRGRDYDCLRSEAARKIADKVKSVYSTLCKRGDTECQYYPTCPLILGYLNHTPGLHLFAHDHVALPKVLGFPSADMAWIDENIIATLISRGGLPGAVLTDPFVYATAKETGEEEKAAILGGKLLAAITAGPEILAQVRAAGITRKDLLTLAKWAKPIENGPDLHPGMSDKALIEAAENIGIDYGTWIGVLCRQIVKELRIDRTIAHGVLYADGDVFVYRRRRLEKVPKSIPLLIIDADADLDENRIFFGKTLEGISLRAKRKGRVTQISGATLSKSYLAPETAFKTPTDKQVAVGKALRDRILAWIASLAGKGKKVLAVTNKPIRRLFTGEEDEKLPTSRTVNGVDWTHYGAFVGCDDWKHFDCVVLIGREQVPSDAAERDARAIYNDDPEPLQLGGGYIKEVRGHRLRNGGIASVEVHRHIDPRVQKRVEMRRERLMSQAIDRLRLIHGSANREIFILCDIPLPGIEIDERMSLDDLLAGGTPAQRLIDYARQEWGVLPLSADWLAKNAPKIATSPRTAKRLIADIKRANSQIESYLQFGPFNYHPVRFWVGPQKRPSEAMFFHSSAAGTAALERLFAGKGRVVVQARSDAEREMVNLDVQAAAPGDQVGAEIETVPEPASEIRLPVNRTTSLQINIIANIATTTSRTIAPADPWMGISGVSAVINSALWNNGDPLSGIV